MEAKANPVKSKTVPLSGNSRDEIEGKMKTNFLIWASLLTFGCQDTVSTQNETELRALRVELEQVRSKLASAETAIEENSTGIVQSETDVSSLWTAVSQNQADIETLHDTMLTEEWVTEHINEGTGELGELATRVDTLENTYSDAATTITSTAALAEKVKVSPDGDVIFHDTNVYIQNGTGNTEDLNGKGNLFIGYNRTDGTLERSGSHNLIVGDLHSFTAHTGLVTGNENQILANYAVALGTTRSQATNEYAVAIGGEYSHVSGMYGTAIGGGFNSVSGPHSVALGGYSNLATGAFSAAAGGQSNIVHGDYATVAGGNFTLVEDLSSTVAYQRDKFSHFLHYWLRFYIVGTLHLAHYFLARRRWKPLRQYLLGELAWLGGVAALWQINPGATFTLFVAPFLLIRFLMMTGNWSQHAFVDVDDPLNPYRSATNLINARYNHNCFNDGYHIIHHLKPGLHWSDMPAEFERTVAQHADQGALVFSEIANNQVVFMALMRGDYDKLAPHLVDLGPPRSHAEKVALLRDRARRRLGTGLPGFWAFQAPTPPRPAAG